MPQTTAKVAQLDADTLTVFSGGTIDVKTGGVIKANGTQAATIADLAAITGGQSPTEEEHNAVVTAINEILAAIKGAGIIASS